MRNPMSKGRPTSKVKQVFDLIYNGRTQYSFKLRAMLVEHDRQGAAFLRHVALDSRWLDADLLQDVAKGMLQLRHENVER